MLTDLSNSMFGQSHNQKHDIAKIDFSLGTWSLYGKQCWLVLHCANDTWTTANTIKETCLMSCLDNLISRIMKLINLCWFKLCNALREAHILNDSVFLWTNKWHLNNYKHYKRDMSNVKFGQSHIHDHEADKLVLIQIM
jgi:hypothetical protein